MLKNMFHFSFHGLFPGKEFSHDETEFCKRIVRKLIEDEKIKGEFDEEDLSFSCTDLLFAKNYNNLLEGFTTMITGIFGEFEIALSKIKNG